MKEEIMVLGLDQCVIRALDEWIKRNKIMEFEDHKQAIEYIIRHYIQMDRAPKYVKLIDFKE